ncbi:hypothetical protein [Streptomyces chattanoogensis]|uniref:Cobyrinic acid a,c-diamide synthase n=1 Tax=Streptomyces chattanoogensis TaxID=66876 RepID=A0A0N1JXG7_9ACTN|nr:hypothetical protein [Streptomyces chattanoogensis]KPC62006.1 hypothetical protein ADL29_21535 [Streptomyces chattanoogensis]
MSLPGADELFRTTGGMGLQSSPPRRPANGSPAAGEPRVPAPAGEADPAAEPGDAAVRQAEDPAADPGRTPAAAPAASSPSVSPAEHSGRAADAAAPKGHRAQPGQAGQEATATPAAVTGTADRTRRRGGRGANRRPSGRERHDEKITVYVSAEELMDLEHARLVLRGEHGLAVDRGRIVREAVAVVLADLESRGDASILVRRLRGR